MELDRYRQCQQAFPWETFPVFSQFFNPKSIFSGHTLSFRRPNCCYSELQSSTLRVFLAIPGFTGSRKTLGIQISSGKNEFEVFKCVTELSEHSRVTQNPGSSGNSHPSCFGVRGNSGMFSMWEWGEKGISSQTGWELAHCPCKLFNKSYYSKPFSWFLWNSEGSIFLGFAESWDQRSFLGW